MDIVKGDMEMDKREFENWTNEILSNFIKVVEMGVEEIKKEIKLDEDEKDRHKKEENSKSKEKTKKEHKNPETIVGDWIVFDDVYEKVELVTNKSYEVVLGACGPEVKGEKGRPYAIGANGVRWSSYRHATDREIMFTKAGRDVNELKVGDIVHSKEWGYVLEVRDLCDNNSLAVGKEINGAAEYTFFKDSNSFTVLCFVEDRKDIQRNRP